MADAIETVRQYYNDNPELEWERLSKHPFEFLFTTHMMDRYIRPGDRVLDIGGGPGRYALHYAKMGCDVTLVDLSEGNIEFAGRMAVEQDVSLAMHAENALALDALALGEFDHVFLMGPLYHLTAEHEREKAVRQALRCLKMGGNLYCSFILDFAGIIYDLKNGPGYLPEDLENPATRRLLDSIAFGTGYEGPAFTSACFFNQTQIDPFMQRFPLEKLHLFGQEGILALNEQQVLAFPEEERALWVETAKRFLEIPALLALSEHAMYIGRKRSPEVL